MSALKYTEEHEWLALKDGIATVGITHFAQEQLGDIVFVELPEIGRTFEQGEEAAVIESVKAAGEINAPVSGTVIAVNEALSEAPDTVNTDPLGDGWFFKLRLNDETQLSELMDENAYNNLVEQA